MAKRSKPDIASRFAEHVALTERLKEAETQARKAAEACVALEQAANRRKAEKAKENCLRWLTVEREIRKQLAAIENNR